MDLILTGVPHIRHSRGSGNPVTLVHILFNNLLDTRVTTSIHGLRTLGHPSDVQIVPDDLVVGMTYFLFWIFMSICSLKSFDSCYHSVKNI